MIIEASFVRSAATAEDLPHDGLAEIALVGRSNVGKSSLINALVRRKIARTSAAPGKTRLANLYRVVRRSERALYLVDLPGYGFARGGLNEFAALIGEYFADARGRRRNVGALLLVDARHPGLESDIGAWRWLQQTVGERCGAVATKIDKLARGERIRAMKACESVLEHPVLPASSATGEGMDELWKLIDRLANNSSPKPRRKPRP